MTVHPTRVHGPCSRVSKTSTGNTGREHAYRVPAYTQNTGRQRDQHRYRQNCVSCLYFKVKNIQGVSWYRTLCTFSRTTQITKLLYFKFKHFCNRWENTGVVCHTVANLSWLENARPRPRPRSVKLLWDRDQKYETETSLVNSLACESRTYLYALLSNYIFEIINDV